MKRRRAIIWAAISLLIPVVVYLAVPFGQPWTVASAVRRIERDLSQEDREWILRNPKETVVVKLHFPLGMHLRNRFGLWGGNWILRASCGHSHPDACSAVILEALWHSVRRSAPPETVRALDEHFQRVQAVKIDYSGFNLLPIGDVLSRIQAQLDQDATVSGNALRLTTSGNPDLNCYTRADLVGEPVPLQLLLSRLSWRNGFSVRHDPPNIELVFHKPCSWPKPPKHFATPEKWPAAL